MDNTRFSGPPSCASDWEQFSAMLIQFLSANVDDVCDDILSSAADLYFMCPADLSALDDVKSAQSLVTEDLNQVLLHVLERLIDFQEVPLSLFCIGLADLGDRADDVLESFLEIVDDGMGLSALVTSYVPRNAFEVNALIELLYWPEFPDWARSHLVVRDGIGMTPQDRDGVIEFLGSRDNLGSDTLVSLAHDIACSKDKYSGDAIAALKAFVTGDFHAVSDFNDSDLEDIEAHFDEIGDHYITKGRRLLCES
jgi:hypothetical protein